MTLRYPSGGIKAKSRSRGKPIDLRRFRLEIDAPGGLIEHTIRVTLADVSLVDPRR